MAIGSDLLLEKLCDISVRELDGFEFFSLKNNRLAFVCGDF